MVGIYKITSPTGKVYIGQSHQIKKRFQQYKGLRCADQPRIYNSLKKHGAESHTFECIAEYVSKTPISQSFLDYLEQFFMNSYRKNGFELMNLREAGDKGRLSDESKRKLRKSLKGINTWSRGRKLTADQVAAIRIRRAKQVFSDDDKRKISEGLRRFYDLKGRKGPIKEPSRYPRVGGKFSEEQRLRYSEERSGEKNQFYGKKHSDETRKLMSLAGKDNKLGAKNGRAKAVNQYDLNMNLIKEWDFINQAAISLNISRQSINNAATGRNKTAHGFIWRYKTENLKSA